MANCTAHGRRRMAERVNATGFNAAKKNAENALSQGIDYKDTCGELRDWLYGKFIFHREMNKVRIYRGMLYSFHDHTLLTVYPIPEEFLLSLEENLVPDAYTRYMSVKINEERKKNDKKIRKYMERREEFLNRVLLDDVKEYAAKRFDVKITAIRFAENRVVVYYIPIGTTIPDLSPIADHIRNCTSWKRVQLLHIKNEKGRCVFHPKYEMDPYEDELVYQI